MVQDFPEADGLRGQGGIEPAQFEAFPHDLAHEFVDGKFEPRHLGRIKPLRWVNSSFCNSARSDKAFSCLARFPMIREVMASSLDVARLPRRLPRWRAFRRPHPRAQGVHGGIGVAQFEMQVRTGGPSRTAHLCNFPACGDAVSRGDIDCA